MDEFFETFIGKFGEGHDRQAVPAATLARYRGKLPAQLLAYWEEHGFCGYANGLFWTVDPARYEPVLEAWIGNTPLMEQDAFHLIARGAMGALYLWGERSGYALKIFAPGAYAVKQAAKPGDPDLGVRKFFALRTRAENDFEKLFEPARQKLGRPGIDEMFGFVPALALGGSPALGSLQRLKAVEHLVQLAQLSELRVLDTPA